MTNTQNLNLGEINIDLTLNENWQKIDEKVINKNGTVPFIAEQIGVDPVSEQGLATKHYVDTTTLKLGETETTAYRGDKGKIAYDHSQTIGNPHNTTKADIGLGNVQNIDTTNTANISDSVDKRFLTDAEKAVLDNTSGINTGDETKESIEEKLGTDFTNLVNRNGTVPFIAEQQGVTPTLSNSLATKSYVDSKLSGDFAQSFASNGYTKLPNGLILQWGYRNNAFTVTQETNTFPIAFPNACLNVIINCLYSGGGWVDSRYYEVTSKSTTQFTVTATGSKYWLAIGY